MSKIFILLCLISLGMQAQTNNTKKKEGDKQPATENKQIEEFEMKQYFFVILKTGPNRAQDSAAAAEIQKGHLEHLTKMYLEGKMDIAGPFMDDWVARGICIYNVATKEEVEELVSRDPAIKSGRLVAEIHPWYAAKNSSLR